MPDYVPVICPNCYQVVAAKPIKLARSDEIQETIWLFVCPACDNKWTIRVYDEDGLSLDFLSGPH